MLREVRRVARAVDRADRALVRRTARWRPSPADAAFAGLGRAADHGVLWMAVAAALSGHRGGPRRAALRGLLALSGASAASNAVAKPLLPRRRPAYEDVPVARRPPRSARPGSSSFPSGHSASAAAFTAAVALEHPVLGAALAPVAAGVAWSRVHTGVHWPSDVAAGLALGAGVALATRRWWPLAGASPADGCGTARAPALPGGEGLVLLVNPAAGTAAAAGDLAGVWPFARLLHARDGDLAGGRLADGLERELAAPGPPVRALGVAGGDGSVAAVAAVAARRGLPLVVLPAGTLNHFARDVGVADAADADRAVRDGTAAPVDLGSARVDGGPPRWFVNTATLGGYPDLVRLRRRWERRWGRWPAAAAALVAVLRDARPLAVRIDGRPARVWLLFVGNGGFRPRGFAPIARARLDGGRLDVRWVRADVPLSRTRFALAALSGALERSRTYVQRECAELDVEVLGDPVALASDGEVGPLGQRFRFTAYRSALTVYRT